MLNEIWNVFATEALEDARDIPPIPVTFEKFYIGEDEIGPVEATLRFCDQSRLILDLGDALADYVPLIDKSLRAQIRAKDDPISILVTRQKIDFLESTTVIEGRFAREPLKLVKEEESVRFEARCLAAPKLFDGPIVLKSFEGPTFTIRPERSEEGASCSIESEANLTANNSFKTLDVLLYFLTFIKGADCGFGNLLATGKGHEPAFCFLGFTRFDQEKLSTNWFDIEIQNELPDIYFRFSKSFSDSLTRRALKQSINYYRASNISRDKSLEMAIIAAHSALESIVNFILEHRAGWSKSLMNNRNIAFSDKNRTASSYFGIPVDLLDLSPELQKFSASHNNMDAFELISFFRNKLVHQDPKTEPTGIQLHEVWLLSQWLLEVLIFSVIGYRGKIIDRRVYSGWRGTTCELPINRCS